MVTVHVTKQSQMSTLGYNFTILGWHFAMLPSMPSMPVTIHIMLHTPGYIIRTIINVAVKILYLDVMSIRRKHSQFMIIYRELYMCTLTLLPSEETKVSVWLSIECCTLMWFPSVETTVSLWLSIETSKPYSALVHAARNSTTVWAGTWYLTRNINIYIINCIN